MSWLSEALKRNGLDVVNKIAAPVIGAGESIARNAIPGAGWAIDAGKAVGGLIPDVSGGIPKLGALRPGGGSSGLGGLFKDPLGLLSVGNSAYLGDKASNFAKLAGESADREWARRAPVRDAGLAGMTAAPRRIPALGAIRTSGANPFAARG